MDQLTRFAQRLVERLAASGDSVHRPVSVGALRDKLLPYRSHRRALGLASVEDYETVLLRLVAEEGGYVKTVPGAAAERCRAELTQATPDLSVLDEVADSTIQVTSIAAARIVAFEGAVAPPPEPREEVSPPRAPAVEATVASVDDPPPVIPRKAKESPVLTDSCAHCSKPVPAGRQVVFCPWCGERLIPFTCARCGTELDSEWRHCITCGAPSMDPFRFP
jgi:hypothetical protein